MKITIPKRVLWLNAALFASLFASMLSAAPMLTLTGGGALTDQAGLLTGWGFSITNDTGYIEITSGQFCVNPVSFPACTTSSIGSFTNFISQFNDIIVGPVGGTLPSLVSQTFDPVQLTGIGSFEFTPGLGPSIDYGQIVLTYNLFDSDPNGASAAFLSSGVLAANASVATQTPEPSYAWPFFAAMALLVFQKRNEQLVKLVERVNVLKLR